MTRTNFRRNLRFFLSRKAFVPFGIELTSGHQVVIRHPEVIELQDELVIFRDVTGGYSVFEHESVVRFLDVAKESRS